MLPEQPEYEARQIPLIPAQKVVGGISAGILHSVGGSERRTGDPAYLGHSKFNPMGYVTMRPTGSQKTYRLRNLYIAYSPAGASWVHVGGLQCDTWRTRSLSCQPPSAKWETRSVNLNTRYYVYGEWSPSWAAVVQTVSCIRCLLTLMHPLLNDLQPNTMWAETAELYLFEDRSGVHPLQKSVYNWCRWIAQARPTSLY